MPDPVLFHRVVVLERCVRFVDEVKELAKKKRDGVTQHEMVEAAIKNLPPCWGWEEMDRQQQRVIETVMSKCRRDMERVYEAVRKRNHDRPSAVRKDPLAFTTRIDAEYYSELLDCINAHLTDPLAPAPPDPLVANIASCHKNFLALYLGTNRPGLHSAGCYLVFNSLANSLAVILPLLPRSHCPTGAGVAVLRHNVYGDYLLAELYRHKDARTQLVSLNKATLFVWCSTGSGPFADPWIPKEVTYSFHANMVLQVSTTSLCWVDLQTGILVCDHLDRLAAGDDGDDVPFFCFIPLPRECAVKSDPRTWMQAEHFRSMCCVNRETIEFVCMDGYSQGRPTSDAMLTRWVLKFPLTNCWRWEKGTTLCVRDLYDGLPFYNVDDSKLQRLVFSCPVMSCAQPDVTYLSVADLRCKHGCGHEHDRWEAAGYYELSIDMKRRSILSVFQFPSESCGVPHPQRYLLLK
ncbi:hypothetical protein PVAP13_7KG272300, partial [Panicum virgatum]